MKPLWNDVKPFTTDWNVSSAGRIVVLPRWSDNKRNGRAGYEEVEKHGGMDSIYLVASTKRRRGRLPGTTFTLG